MKLIPRMNVFIFFALPALFFILTGFVSQVSAQGCGFSLISSDENRIVLRFELPPWKLEPVEAAGADFSQIRTQCGEDLLASGYPIVPQYKALVAVPPGSQASLRWSGENSLELHAGRLLPAQPASENRGDEDSELILSNKYSDELSKKKYYPQEKVTLLGPKRFRDLMVVEILVYPFTYEPASGTLQVTETFQVTVDIHSSENIKSYSSGMSGEKSGEELYRRTILNYQSSAGWRIPREGSAKLAADLFSQGEHWVSLRLKKSDMYALSGSRLAQAGIDLSGIDPATFRLFSGGGRMLDEDPGAPEPVLAEVALLVSGGQVGSFSEKDRLIFYGEGLDRFTVHDTGAVSSIRHRYESYSVYWLTWGSGSGSGSRMAEYSIPPQPGAVPRVSAEIWYHWEENTRYLAVENAVTGQTLNLAPDYWAWVLESDQSGVAERSFDLDKAPEADGQFLRYEIYGTIGNDLANYSISINDKQVFSGFNFSINPVTSTWVTLPEGIVNKDGNNFTLRGSGQALGFFELRAKTPLTVGAGERVIFHELSVVSPPFYEALSTGTGLVEAFDITVQARPVRLGVQKVTGDKVRFSGPASGSKVRSFAMVSDNAYREPDLVRSERLPDLRDMAGAEYLVLTSRELSAQAEKLALFRSSAYRTAVADVEDIYNEFSLGPADPAAIRNFLQYAFTSWRIRPQFVVLFGDGHNDFRGVTQAGRSKPNHILPYITSEDLEIDEWYVRFSGSDLPQIAFGRIPAETKADAETVVDKIIKYEGGADAGDWARRLILLADDGYALGGTCDIVTNHVPGSEELDSLFPPDMERRKIYLDEYPFDPPGIGTRKPAANEALLAWWNRGSLVVNYLGHGSSIHWAQERIFDVEQDLPMLTNGYRLPLVLNSSCSIGHFDSYTEQAMAERLLNYKGGGAVAVYAGTRITYAFQNLALNKLMVSYLFSGSDWPIGFAALEARLNLGGIDRGNAMRYLIFGDPALRLHTPGRKLRIETDGGGELAAGRKITFTGRVVDNSGKADASFSGVAQIKFLGGARPVKVSYQCRASNGMQEREVNFISTPAMLFNGPVTVSGGTFKGAFVMPVNLAGSLPVDTLNVQNGNFIGYATSDRGDASGAGDKSVISRVSPSISDTSAPRISLFSQGRELSDGDRVSRSEPLSLVIKDESGINTTGGPGAQLTMEVDQGLTYAADLTPLFCYKTDSYQEGTVTADLQRVGEGLHSFSFRATDNALNTARIGLMLFVEAQRKNLLLTNVVNYPNPFPEETDICFEISEPADVKIRIFTVAGRPVRELERYSLPAGFNTVRWDGRDEYRQKIANGVYIYRIICRASVSGSVKGTQEVEAIGKALLSR